MENIIINSISLVNPAVQAKTDTITVLAGTNVSIEFYASGIPFITSNDITWTFNDSVTVTDIINNNSDRRILVINSANSTHNGVYKMTVNSTVSATTKLTVLSKLLISKTPGTPFMFIFLMSYTFTIHVPHVHELILYTIYSLMPSPTH